MTDEIKETRSTVEVSNVVMCSICLDSVSDDVDRSTAKLHCGHLFHLDCIGSAFNIKGAMQCPNCRKVEKGRWLYASGSTTRNALPEMINMNEYNFHEDQYHGLSYPEIPFNIHWCPFSGLARVHSAFEALESSPPPPPPPYHNLHRHQNMFPVNMSASSTINETIEDPNISYQWNGVSNNPHVFSSTENMHYHNDQGSVAPVTLRSSRGSYMHPFLFGHGSSRLHERLQPSHTIHHHHQPTNPLGMPTAIIPSMTRFHGRRALPPLHVPTNSASNRNGGFFIAPPRDLSLQSSHETPASSVSDRNGGGFFIVPPRGAAVQSSHETTANSISDRNGGFLVIPSQGSLAESSNETENALPVMSSDSHRTGNSWNGHWS